MTDTTAQPPRQAGLRGLLPKNEELHAALPSLADVGFVLPAPKYPIDKSSGITEWGMGGNGPDPTLTANHGNPAGDCGPCACPFHADELAAKLFQLAMSTPWTSNLIMELYLRYNKGQDLGVDLGAWLLWLFQEGLIDAFIKVPLDQQDAALDYFDIVVVGVDLNDQADAQFENHEVWDIGAGDEPDPTEGHAILFAAAASKAGKKKYVTWGGIQAATERWRKGCVQQCFAVLVKEQALAKGFPYEAAVAKLKQLGGTAA